MMHRLRDMAVVVIGGHLIPVGAEGMIVGPEARIIDTTGESGPWEDKTDPHTRVWTPVPGDALAVLTSTEVTLWRPPRKPWWALLLAFLAAVVTFALLRRLS